MNLKSIFVDESSGEGLYAVQYDNEEFDEFERLMDMWSNTKYVQQYFISNEQYLKTAYYNGIEIGEATFKVLSEQDELERLVYKYAESGFDGHESLQMLFLPLIKESTVPINQSTKGKVESRNFPRFLRLYAIRIDKNTFIISGGAIKITKFMDEHFDTKAELEKIKLLRSFLLQNDIQTLDDLNYFL